MRSGDRLLLGATAKLVSKLERDVAHLKAAVLTTFVLPTDSDPVMLALAEKDAYYKKVDTEKAAGNVVNDNIDKYVVRGLVNGTLKLAGADPQFTEQVAVLTQFKTQSAEWYDEHVLVCVSVKCFKSSQKKFEISLSSTAQPSLIAMQKVWGIKLNKKRMTGTDARGSLARDVGKLLSKAGLDKKPE